MKTLASLLLALPLSTSIILDLAFAQTPEINAVRYSEAALAFSSGAIQKTTPIDGIVNLITGDNQSVGNRLLLSKQDTIYLKLTNPSDVLVGNLFTVYRRVRKVFHPVTKEYLGFVMNRSAIVKVTATNHALTTVEVVHSYSPVFPGDPVVRFAAPTTEENPPTVSDSHNLEGMIVELQSNQVMTLVSQSNVVYVDRGSEDGLKSGDLLEIYRYNNSVGLPPQTIGKLKVLSTEPHTASAKIIKATSRVLRGDRFKFSNSSTPILQPTVQPTVQPSESPSESQTTQVATALPADSVAKQLHARDATGQSRINLGDLSNFLHYDSGDAAIKSDNYKVLDQLVDYLRASGDTRLIRIEGHTDNVEIGPSLKPRYPSNLELSSARANGVARYLAEKGGIDVARLSAVGYGDTKPSVPNTTEEGRTKNRRVEILLHEAETSTTKSQPDPLDQIQPLGKDLSTTQARGGSIDQSTRPTVSQDTTGSTSTGTFSVTDVSQGLAKDDGSGVSNPSTDRSSAPTAERVKQETPSQQPTTGTPSE